MGKLSPRERVILTFNHREPDRVPFDLMGSASLIIDKIYFNLLEYLGLTQNQEPWRDGFTANYYDERLLDLFDIDFRRVWMLRSQKGQNVYKSKSDYICPWGITWKLVDLYVNPINSPLRGLDMNGIEDYPWPEPSEVWQIAGVSDRAREMFENSDYAIVARNPVVFGLLDRACLMRGTEQFMMDLLLDPELAHALIDKILNVHIKMYDMFLGVAGPYVQMVETADDLGAQNSLLISPELYRQFIKPAQKKIHDLIKDRAPQAKIFFHCDGAIYDIIADLIEIGVDILNPIQSSAKGMSSERLKSSFGDKLVFHGGVDQVAIGGSNNDVRNEVRHRIDLLAQGGGYVLSPCNNIVDAPPENIVALFEEASRYGTY
jgi:uroporphyrinogen decarboxylase